MYVSLLKLKKKKQNVIIIRFCIKHDELIIVKRIIILIPNQCLVFSQTIPYIYIVDNKYWIYKSY